jgi:hypothetical protein
MKSFNAYGQTTKSFGGNIPVWLGTVRPIPVGAVLEAEFIVDKALYRAGTPVQYNAEARTFKPLTPDAVAGANGYLYNDIYIDSVADTDVDNAATGAIVMHHAEGLLIENTAFAEIAHTLATKIPGVYLVRNMTA